jgi:hypothetical protein
MGYANYSDDAAAARVTSRVDAGKPAVASYTADVRSGAAPAKAHKDLDPKGMLFRESRDSDNHPESVPVIIGLDQTGSMGRVVKQIQKSITPIMKLLVDKGYLPHPHIMVIGIGDSPNMEAAPLQVSQFESDDKIEACIDSIYIEGNGGGQNKESYQNAAYVAGFKTRTDHFEKRGQKGYFFIIGDEMNHRFERQELIDLIGTADERGLSEEMTTQQIYERAKERYHIFFVLPKNAQNGGSPVIKNHWKALLGEENVLELADENAAGEFIAAQIGLCEDRTDLDTIARDIVDIHGTGAHSHALVAAVTGGVSTTYKGQTLARVPAGSLTPSTNNPVSIDRL